MRCVSHILSKYLSNQTENLAYISGSECSYLGQFLGSFGQGVSELGDLKVEKYIEIFPMLFQAEN